MGPSAGGSSSLGIQSVRDGERLTLILTGELDIASAPTLEARAQELSEHALGELVLDLSELEFIDSAGLNAILRIRALCEEQLCDFCLTPGAKPVHRLFEVTRLLDRLTFRKSRTARDEEHTEEGTGPGAPAGDAERDPSERDT